MEIYFEDETPQLASAATGETPGLMKIFVSGSIRFSYPLSTSYQSVEVASKGNGMGSADWMRNCALKSISSAENSGEYFTNTTDYIICRLKLTPLTGFSTTSFSLDAVKTFRIPSGNSVETNSQQFYSHAVFGTSTEGTNRTIDILIPKKDIYGTTIKSTSNKITIYITVRVQA